MIRLINFYNNDHLDFLPLTQNPLCLLPGTVQLAFSIGKNFVMIMIKKMNNCFEISAGPRMLLLNNDFSLKQNDDLICVNLYNDHQECKC